MVDTSSPSILVEPNETARQLREYVRNHPEIRKDEYQFVGDPVAGACYVLAEAYFHAEGGRDAGFNVYRLDWEEVSDNSTGSHWFLRNDAGDVVDLSLPTARDGEQIPWNQARHRAFITGYTPSKRAARLLNGVGLAH